MQFAEEVHSSAEETDADEEEIFTRRMFTEEEEESESGDTDYDGVSLSSYSKGALKQSVIEGFEIIERKVCEIDSLWCTISEIDNHNKLLQRELNERKRKFAEIDRRPIEEDRHKWEMEIMRAKLRESLEREKRKDAEIAKLDAEIAELKARLSK